MQKRTMRSLPLAALLAASAHAQSSTITSTIPVCPTAASITITLPTTVTFCPGPHCNGGGSGPQITPAPVNGVGMPGVNVGQYTSVGPDGKTTVLGIWETVYNSMCETGLVPATYTITAECPCEVTPHPTVMPTGFETTVVPCSICAHPTVTLTQPCPTGPYASQTPSTGKAPAMPMPVAPAAGSPAATMPGSGASASAGSGAAASAGSAPGSPGAASAGAGSGAAASAGPAGASAGSGSGASAGIVSPAGASAGAGSGSGASAQAGPGGASASAGSGSGASAQSGPGGASANAGSGASAQAGSDMPATNGMGMNGTVTNMSAGNTTTMGKGPIQPYMSSAGQASFAGFTLFAAFVASLLL